MFLGSIRRGNFSRWIITKFRNIMYGKLLYARISRLGLFKLARERLMSGVLALLPQTSLFVNMIHKDNEFIALSRIEN